MDFKSILKVKLNKLNEQSIRSIENGLDNAQKVIDDWPENYISKTPDEK